MYIRHFKADAGIKLFALEYKMVNDAICQFLCLSLFQVIRTTGFMKGLYGENEMKSDNVKVRCPPG